MISLSIPDMSCAHCKATVTAALAQIPGVSEVEVDLDNRTARVEGSTPLAALLSTLDQAGYSAKATD